MDAIIVYGSCYGSARRYAEQLSKMTGLRSVSHQEAGSVDGCGLVVYVGALYAGGVLGLRKTAARLREGQRLWVATVGLADPADMENVGNIRFSLKGQIPARLYDERRLFHLRGAIDYSRLGFKHRIMMSMLHSKVAKMPEEELNAEAHAMLDTYGQRVDFVDFQSLVPLAEAVKAAQTDACTQ